MSRIAALSFPLAPWICCSLSVLSGALYWLAFPSVDAWPLTFVAWVPLVLALHRQQPRQGAIAGLLAGLTMNLLGFSWLQNMLLTFSGFHWALCLLFVVIICAYQGGRIALQGWLHTRLAARGWSYDLAFAASFVTSELSYPLLFPWYYAATVHRVSLLTQTADIGGPILVGLILVAANLFLAEVALAWLETRKPRRRSLVSVALALAFACAYGALRIRAVDADAGQASQAAAGVVQADMGLIEKRADYSEGLRRHLAMSDDLRLRGADFVVWSETSAMRPVREETYTSELKGLARTIQLPAIFGAVIFKPVSGPRDHVLYNAALSSDADGVIEGRYDKEYLLAFGEYLPFGDVLPILYEWSPNSGHFTPGTSLDPLLLDVKGERHAATALICYEDILPGFTNDAVRHGNPDLLVNITNDAWFGDTAEPWQHLALSEFRAIEHRRYLVRGTNSGVSAVVDPVGRVVAHTGAFRRETLLAPVRWMRSRTLFERVGNWPWIAIALLAVVAAFRKRRLPVAAPRATASTN
jgi:apolipoprotein N-acyltransferase